MMSVKIKKRAMFCNRISRCNQMPHQSAITSRHGQLCDVVTSVGEFCVLMQACVNCLMVVSCHISSYQAGLISLPFCAQMTEHVFLLD